MSAATRLSLALETGHVALPEDGTIAFFRPPSDLPDLIDRTRVQVIHGFRPTHDAFAARGYDTRPTAQGPFAAAIVFLPRARAHAHAMIAKAMSLTTAGNPVIIDGSKTDGIESILKSLRKDGFAPGEALSKAHGKTFTVNAQPIPAWAATETTLPSGQVTRPGAFSADGIDPASALLASALPPLNGTIADLGAGWGYLSGEVLKSDKVETCHLIEAEYDALDAARQNITDPRAHFHWADATTFDAVKGFDHIVTNPPFHTSRSADPALGQAFIQASARLIAPRGTVWLVANRHLPYESALRQNFAELTELPGDKGFKLYRASRPKAKKAR